MMVKKYCCHNIFEVTLTILFITIYFIKTGQLDVMARIDNRETELRWEKKIEDEKTDYNVVLRNSWWAIFHALNSSCWSLSRPLTSVFIPQHSAPHVILSWSTIPQLQIVEGGIINGHCASLPPFLECKQHQAANRQDKRTCSVDAHNSLSRKKIAHSRVHRSAIFSSQRVYQRALIPWICDRGGGDFQCGE